jgi:chemotaxis protein histidine kinase CheA
LSDDFLKVAQKEVKEDIECIEAIINSCKNDSDISVMALRIEKHLHKIKGIAPMMGQNDIGEISQLADKLIKHVIDKGQISNSYQILSESVKIMKQLLNGNVQNPSALKEKLRQASIDFS